MESDQNLKNEIEEVGLDVIYWKPIFEEIQISSVERLTDIGNETVQNLISSARNKSELSALQYLISAHKSTKHVPEHGAIPKTDDSGHVAKQATTSVGADAESDSNANLLPLPENTALSDLISCLGLEKFFERKICLHDVLTFSDIPISAKEVSSFHLPWKLLNGLIRLDHSVRYDISLEKTETERKTLDSFSSVADFLAWTDDLNQNNDDLHPADVFLAIFYCCSSRLRQILFQKLFKCKIALPICIMDPNKNSACVNLWPLRTVAIEFMDINGEFHEQSCVDAPSDIVSIVRIGTNTTSKSRILNTLLIGQTNLMHDSFMNRHCPHATNKRILSGYVEGSWFIPAKQNDKFRNVTLFLNLRGEARDHPKVAGFLARVSSCIVVMVNVEDLNTPESVNFLHDIGSKNKNMILLLCSGSQNVDIKKVREALSKYNKSTPVTQLSDLLFGLEKNETHIAEHLKSKLCEKLSKLEQKTIEKAIKENAEACQIDIDERNQEIMKGKDLAKQVLSCFEDDSFTKVRTNVLPLQGDAWLKYSELLKEERNMSNCAGQESVINKKDRIRIEMNKQRQLQYSQLTDSLKHVQTFAEVLVKYAESGNVIDCFLKCLELGFDAKSRSILPEELTKYNEAWRKYRLALKGKEHSDETLNMMLSEVRRTYEHFNYLSIGLEHMFRELGQFYETVMINTKVNIDDKIISLAEQLPVAMAKLITRGYNFEIMDGDVSNIPIQWVTAVLQKLYSIVGDKRFFVVSNLGLQSSGKSTLFNTMFGMEFAASAGRCTKGIFAHLLPVPHNKCISPKYQYILVLDTEGLRAPELSMLEKSHDNILATLTMGLADVTVVNIKGENAAEITDILEIAIHAFLRMKMADKVLKSQQKCFFVHNNVSALIAKDQLQRGKHKLEETLDKMTISAARQLDLQNVYSFHDALDFDCEKHIAYLPDLWLGSPPMAPVNPSYVTKVADVEKCLTVDIGAFLAEDFIFSFRNSLEALAYESVTKTFLELKRSLSRQAMNWVDETGERQMIVCTTTEDLDIQFKKTLRAVEGLLSEKESAATCDLEAFFDDGHLKEIKVQWKQNKMYQFAEHAQTILKKAKDRLQYLRDKRHLALVNTDLKHRLKTKFSRTPRNWLYF